MSRSSGKDPKMVICIRSDLGMSVGKMVSQGCHAALGVVQEIKRTSKHNEILRQWNREASAKIITKVDSLRALEAVQKQAIAAGLPHYVVVDAGRTEIESGSITAIAVGPARSEEFDGVTDHLKLL